MTVVFPDHTHLLFLHGVPFYLVYNMTTLRKTFFYLTLDAEGVCKGKLCDCMMLYTPFPLI